MSVIEITKLTKNYGHVRALNQLDLRLEQGEVLGFIGPNGAGKTTTIRILLGLLRATSGEAKLFGKDAWQDSVAIHKALAYVPGDVNLWPNLTGGEVIDLLARLRGGLDNERRARLLSRFDLDPTKKCHTYSKGNRQKVALVAAFASDADLFILDEPTSGLDPLMTMVFQECVSEVKAKGKSVLMSSHILADVEKLCDRVSIIRKGEIVETGSLSELRHLTRISLEVETARPLVNLESLTGIHGLKQTGKNKASMQVDSDSMEKIMNHLNPFGIRALVSQPPTLEELFIRHYGEHLNQEGA